MKRIVAAAVLIALAAGCTKVSTQGESTTGAGRSSSTIPHVLRYSDAEDVAGLNPVLVQQGALQFMSSLTMAFLVKYDEHNQPYPELLTVIPTQRNGGISADGKTITWRLRKDAKWSDGVPFNADDVVFSTKVVLNPANNIVSRDGWDLITKIDEPDKYTVVYHLKKPYAPYMPSFFGSAGANPCILPKHLLEKYPNINNVAYNALPVGIGPFKFKEWKRGEHVEMVADPLYFRGKPKLERVIYEIIPDRNTVLTQLQSGQLDMWVLVSPSYYKRVQVLPGFATVKTSSYYVNHFELNTTHPVFRDPRVRQALRYATNRPELREKLGNGLGHIQDSPTSPAVDVYDASIGAVPFDIAKANALLDAAGWKRGPDGIRVKGPTKLTIDFASSSGTPDVDREIEFLRRTWGQAGFGITVRHYPAPLLFAPMASGGILYNGKFDLAAISWGGDPVGDLSILYDCSSVPPAGQNVTRYCNPALTPDFAKFKQTYAVDQRRPFSYSIQRAVARDVPSLITTAREDIFTYSKDVKGFTPSAASPFDNMLNVDI